MSYYSRERDWDDTRPVTIKRYVVPPEDDRRDFMSRHEDPYAGEREMVIRRKTDRDEPVSIQRYEREVDYETPARYERYYEEREYLHPNWTRRARPMEHAVEPPPDPRATADSRSSPCLHQSPGI